MEMNKAELYKRIMQLAFVKNELELFLDTHPSCRAALEHYYRTVDEYNTLVGEYEGKYGPITIYANNDMNDWHWIDRPWPWEREANA